MRTEPTLYTVPTPLRGRTAPAMLHMAMKARSQPSLVKTLRAISSRAKAEAARGPRVPVPVLIAYGDVASARQAMSRVNTLVRTLRDNGELQPMLWRFDQLDDPKWREMALRDAGRASALVLAMTDEAAFCPRTEAWVNALLGRSRGTSLTVLALVGGRDAWTITLAQPAGAARETPRTAPPLGATEVFASLAPKRVVACAA